MVEVRFIVSGSRLTPPERKRFDVFLTYFLSIKDQKMNVNDPIDFFSFQSCYRDKYVATSKKLAIYGINIQ